MMEHDRIDFAIATGSHELFPDTTLLPLYRWHRTVVVPRGHALAGERRLTLKALARHPIITYSFSFTGPSSLNEIFAAADLEPHVALTARDADVIKTYVRLGLGVGIVASVAVEPGADDDLVAIDAAHIFPTHTTWVGVRQGTLLRKYMYEFLQALGDHLDRRSVDRAEITPGRVFDRSSIRRRTAAALNLPYGAAPATCRRRPLVHRSAMHIISGAYYLCDRPCPALTLPSASCWPTWCACSAPSSTGVRAATA